jgi:hypothetical protein
MGQGVVVYTCNPSYSGVGGRRITVPGKPEKTWHKIYVKSKLKAQGSGVWLAWWNEVLSSIPGTLK